MSHTAINIATELTKIIEKWGLIGKVKLIIYYVKFVTTLYNYTQYVKSIACTVDGAANVQLAITLMAFLSKFTCVTHMLNLVMKNMMEDREDPIVGTSAQISDLLKKCRSLVGLFNHSTPLIAKLAATQQLNKQTKLKFDEDVTTRYFYLQ